ncbi:MAG: gliding motility-associated C-terminal domain-containing protein [Haliscomenobacteraceae bacterium CHB4]|nr:gliding motility-associated C-terminal domain-containing protein [Haliscomenobacteraceae bacterium CHB4]
MQSTKKTAATFFAALLLTMTQAQPSATCDDLELVNGFQGWSAMYGKWKEDLSTCDIEYTSASIGFVNWRHQINYPSAGMVPCFGNNQIPYVPPGYDKAIQLGNWDDGKEWERLSTTINVSEDNSMIEVNLAVFLEDPSHNICRQPRFRIRVYDDNHNIIPCGEYEVFASSSLPGWGTSDCDDFKPVRFLPWTKMSIDLRSYLGENVTLEFQTMDCSEGGHCGFALFALRCLKSEISSTSFCPQLDNSITLSAPEGFSVYQWSNGATDRIITINNPQPGQTYTVTLTPYSVLNGSCQIEMEYTIPPIPALFVPSDTTFCENSGVFIHASATSNYFSYNWENGSQSNSIYVNIPGTYSVTATDGFCTLIDSVKVQENPLPSFQISSVNAPCFDHSGQVTITPDDPSAIYNYAWSTNQTGPIQNLLAGQYTVTVSDESGCSRMATITIDQPAQPDLQLPPGAVKCPGAGITLEAVGNFINYQWSNNSQGPSVNVVVSGLYTVTATDASGCTVAKSVAVSDYPNPQVILIGADSTLCPNTTTNLTVNVAPASVASYSWSGANLTGAGGEVGAGTYAVTITDTNGCTGSDTFEVVTVPAPIATVTSNKQILCKPEMAVLSVSTSYPVVSYNWSIPGQTSTQLEINTGGTYSVIVQDAEGCADTANYYITSYEYVAPSISGDLEICPGQESTTLVAGGPSITAYQWTFQQATVDSISVSTGGTYAVTVTYDYGCTGSNNVTVTEYTLPQPQIQAPSAICQYATSFISTAGIYAAYQWSNSAATAAVEVSAGTYSVTVTDVNGCTGSAGVSIEEVPLYSVSLTAPQFVCNGQPAAIELTVHPDNPSGIAWLSGASGLSAQVALSQGTAKWLAYPPYTDTYKLDSLVISGYDCPFLGLPAMDSVEVDKIALKLQPKLLANNYPLLCPGDSNAEVSAIVQNGLPPYNYTWSPVMSGEPVQQGLSAGTYNVTVTGANGCTVEAQTTVSEPEHLEIIAQVKAPGCYGKHIGVIGFQKLSGQGQVSFEVNGGMSVAVPGEINGLAPGTYNIHVSDEFCHWDTTVIFPQLPQYFIEFQDTLVALELPGPYHFQTITNAPLTSIRYSPGEIMDDSTALRPVAHPVQDTWVTVEAYTPGSCLLTDRIYLKVTNSGLVYVPNVFRPGSDGENAIFYISARESAVRKMSIQIFDRWGGKVFEKADFLPNYPSMGWDGMSRGQYVNPGVFTWHLRVEYVDNTIQNLKGDVTAIR